MLKQWPCASGETVLKVTLINHYTAFLKQTFAMKVYGQLVLRFALNATHCFWPLKHDRWTETYDISHISKTSSISFLTQEIPKHFTYCGFYSLQNKIYKHLSMSVHYLHWTADTNNGYQFSITTQIAKFMGPTWGPPGSFRPQKGPCWPHEPCYQGIQTNQYQLAGWLNTKASSRTIIVTNWPAAIFRIVIRYQWRMEVERLAVLFDLSAVFDIIYHYRVLHPRGSLSGIQGKVLDWFQSYLTGRTQMNSICSMYSVIKHLKLLPHLPEVNKLMFSLDLLDGMDLTSLQPLLKNKDDRSNSQWCHQGHAIWPLWDETFSDGTPGIPMFL